jgi:hypothetical protein
MANKNLQAMNEGSFAAVCNQVELRAAPCAGAVPVCGPSARGNRRPPRRLGSTRPHRRPEGHTESSRGSMTRPAHGDGDAQMAGILGESRRAELMQVGAMQSPDCASQPQAIFAHANTDACQCISPAQLPHSPGAGASTGAEWVQVSVADVDR